MYEFVDQRVDRPGRGSQFILWVMRNWTNAVAQAQCAPRILAPSFAGAGALESVKGFHLTMAFLISNAAHKLAVLPSVCGRIGEAAAAWAEAELSCLDPARTDAGRASL